MAMRAAASYPATTAARNRPDGCLRHGLRKRQSHGVHGGAQMNGAAAVGIILFDAVRSRSVGQRRESRQRADARADDGGASRSARALNHALHSLRRFLARPANRYRQIVEQEIARAVENLRRQILRLNPMQKFDQFARIFRIHGAHPLSRYFFRRLRAMISRCNSLVPPPITTSGASR